jgi:hypothetical protein
MYCMEGSKLIRGYHDSASNGLSEFYHAAVLVHFHYTVDYAWGIGPITTVVPLLSGNKCTFIIYYFILR